MIIEEELKKIKSKEIDEIINQLKDEGGRLRTIGQTMIDTANLLNSVVYYYGHEKEKE